jgi:hypothetical protein
MGNLVWLKGEQSERRLILRTTDETHRAVSEILIENGQGLGNVDAANVLDSVKIDGRLVEVMSPARRFGSWDIEYPMNVPHRRVLVPSDLEHVTRQWCASHGFEDVVADPATVCDERLPASAETDAGQGQYALVVYEGFLARIWSRDDDAYVGDGDHDGTPLRRFLFERRPGSVLVKGVGGFDGFAGIRFPSDPQGEREFRELLSEAASWLAAWQVEHGWSHNSDWAGWSDDDARAYAVSLFQGVQAVLDSSPVMA